MGPEVRTHFSPENLALISLLLSLTRWRSEDMAPYQSHPEYVSNVSWSLIKLTSPQRAQFAFILNLEQHWYTLRRFGIVDHDDGNGHGHWFNLNSFLPLPEWVSRTYLGMVLQQAETEGEWFSKIAITRLTRPIAILGYSVFAVTAADSSHALAVPRTEADDIAATLPDPTSGPSAQRRATASSLPADQLGAAAAHRETGFENEDYELQAALQASLMAAQGHQSFVRMTQPSVPSAPSVPPPVVAAAGPNVRYGSETPPHASQSPPSGASLLLPGHADVDPVTAGMERNRVLLQRMREQQEFAAREMWSEAELSPEEQQALNERRELRRQQEEEEEEELRRAIEESERLALERQASGVHDMETDAPAAQPWQSSSRYNGQDDEDAELQAALKASLEHAGVASPPPPNHDTDETESVLSEDAVASPLVESLSVDEIRKRRLAKFGL
jgi:ataxin-3